jgi:hypothetical protein
MKKAAVFASVFVVMFLFGVGIVTMAPSSANAKPPYNPPLPCNPDDIYCTSIGCAGTYHGGGIFYCYPDFNTEYCSGDWYYPVPCSHIM